MTRRRIVRWLAGVIVGTAFLLVFALQSPLPRTFATPPHATPVRASQERDKRALGQLFRQLEQRRERNKAIQKGLVYMLSKIGPTVNCRELLSIDQTDLADAVINLMFSSTHRPQVARTLAEYRKRCDTDRMRNFLWAKALGHSQRGQLEAAVDTLQYRQKILGAPRQPLQGKCQQACTKYVESQTDSAKFVFKTHDALPLLKRFGPHGAWDFSWALNDTFVRIEEFEDFAIQHFDLAMWGLTASNCGLPLFDLETRFLAVLRERIRPYPDPGELAARPGGDNLLYRTLYFITHLVYYVTNWAATKPRIEMQMEKQFLRRTLEFCTRVPYSNWDACNELDITGEVIDSLMLMGETDNHLAVNNKRREIIRRQSKDGSWVGDDPDDVEHFHSTYNSMNGLVYHDEKWLQSGLGNSTVPSEDYRLDPQDLDAAFRNLRLIPVNTAGKTDNGQQWE